MLALHKRFVCFKYTHFIHILYMNNDRNYHYRNWLLLYENMVSKKKAKQVEKIRQPLINALDINTQVTSLDFHLINITLFFFFYDTSTSLRFFFFNIIFEWRIRRRDDTKIYTDRPTWSNSLRVFLFFLIFLIQET